MTKKLVIVRIELESVESLLFVNYDKVVVAASHGKAQGSKGR